VRRLPHFKAFGSPKSEWIGHSIGWFFGVGVLAGDVKQDVLDVAMDGRNEINNLGAPD
jgi:hypothetical protein